MGSKGTRPQTRHLAIAWDSGAVPVVVLTKKDLCDDVPAYVQRTQDTAMGVEILVVSSLDSSYEELMEYIHPGKTYALIGSSGVGKSTLINRLTGGNIRTDGLRNDDKGHHTTTHRELIELACGAYVIDTPGMRELGMWDSADGIDMVFSDIEELAVHCRFKNCSHETEPGCAIQQALAEGRLASERWNSYRKLALENAFAADQSGYLEAKKEKFKAISRINKKNRKK